MNISIEDSKCNGLNAIVAKLNTEAESKATEEDPTVLTTPEAYLSARIDDMLASYDRQLIEEAKRQYDDVVTLAATLSPEKQAQLIAAVQELAAS